jgi:hypothetical protein
MDNDDTAPLQLVDALRALLRSPASPPVERQAMRAEARAAVTSFVRGRRAQGERADRVLAYVREAWRRAQTLHGDTVDRLAEPWRTLREEVVRWAMRADAPDVLPRRDFATSQHELPANF